MKTSGIRVALPAQEVDRARTSTSRRCGVNTFDSRLIEASDARRASRLEIGLNGFSYPAQARSSGEFTQAVIQVGDVRAAVEEVRGRGVEFEEYNTPETRTEGGIARMPDGGEVAWFKDSEGNLVGVVPAFTAGHKG